MRSNTGVRAVYPCRFTRISYHVGRPWMFEGNTFFPVTGTPMRKMACMISPFADADPVPLAVAILNAKLLMVFMNNDGGQLPASSCQLPAPDPKKPCRGTEQKLGAGSW